MRPRGHHFLIEPSERHERERRLDDLTPVPTLGLAQERKLLPDREPRRRELSEVRRANIALPAEQ